MMEQNIIIDTKDGKVRLQFEKCMTCKYHEFCYMEAGHYHKGTPRGISEECLEEGVYND